MGLDGLVGPGVEAGEPSALGRDREDERGRAGQRVERVGQQRLVDPGRLREALRDRLEAWPQMDVDGMSSS